jgi:excisionase family DNA binding protein
MTEALAPQVARLHNINSAQNRLGVGRSKVFQLIASGELRSVQIGNRRLIPEAAIVDFINKLDAEAASA